MFGVGSFLFSFFFLSVIPGIPIIHMNRNVVVVETPSKSSLEYAHEVCLLLSDILVNVLFRPSASEVAAGDGAGGGDAGGAQVHRGGEG
jgi:hypothetical protein